MDKKRDLVKGEYVTRDDLLLDDWDAFNEIGLITWPCAWGKSTLATNTTKSGLLSAINDEMLRRDQDFVPIKPWEVLFITTRTTIREQLIERGKINEVKSLTDMLDKPILHADRVWGTLFQKVGYGLCSGEHVPDTIRLIIFDEVHSLFADYFAGETTSVVKEWLLNSKAIRIFMTATPQPLEYIFGRRDTKVQRLCQEQFPFKFRKISNEKPPKFTFTKVNIVSGAGPSTIIRRCHGKVMVFVYSAKEAVRLAERTPRSMAGISRNHDKEDKDGIPLKDKIDWSKIDYLKSTGHFPKGIDVVFLTSAYREGLDLKETIDCIIVQSYMPHEIIQCLNRCRTSVPEVYVCGLHDRKMYESVVSNAYNVIDMYDRTDDNQDMLAGVYAATDEQCYIYRSLDGTWKIDRSIQGFWEYQDACYKCATNYNGKRKSLPSYFDYYKKTLEAYTNDLNFEKPWTDAGKQSDRRAEKADRNRQVVEDNKAILNPYLGKWLGRQEKKQLVEDFKGRGFDKGLTTLKRILKDLGFHIEQKSGGEHRLFIS